MTDQKFPFLRLPDNLRSKVSQTTEYLEIIAYSFLSKKSYSMVKALRLPILNVMITMKKQPQIEVTLSFISIKFELNMPENDEKITHLNGFPVDVKVTYLNFENYEFNEKITTWTNQGKTVGEWIQHLCSLNQPKNCYVTDFYVREIELDVQTFHNTFPKPFSVNIIFHQAEADENDIMSAQNVLKAFQLVSQYFRFERFPFQHHLSLQHIGMENSKILVLRYPRNLRIDDFLTLNAKNMTDQRFPFHRLPDDLRLKVLQTTNHLEIMAYSFLSKKACSTVKDLHLPIFNVIITMKKQLELEVTLSCISIQFELNMLENDEKMTHLSGLPVGVKVTYLNFENHEFNEKISTWTNQGKTVGEWIKHLRSISQPKFCYVNVFHHIGMGNLKWLDMQSPRNLNVLDLSTLNAETIWIKTDQMSLRDLNRFFKLWKKGSNPKLEELSISWNTDNLLDWNVMLKGLKAKPTRNSRENTLSIENCRGVCGELKCEWWPDLNRLRVEFTVPK
ncbi:hypothetical protein B9Z55_011178 [Caenorhabditis nigoni]|nr:hypothetical protein B9Z55_011178 [Caenorhabditis nigoni]